MEGVRTAIEADEPRLLELYGEAIDASRAARGAGLYRQPERSVAPSERLSGAGRILVGTLHDYPVGFALCNRRGDTGVVEELFVEPAAREVGVGEHLLTAAVEWFTETGCSGIDLSALPGDRETKNLCERMGFTARVLVMHKRL